MASVNFGRRGTVTENNLAKSFRATLTNRTAPLSDEKKPKQTTAADHIRMIVLLLMGTVGLAGFGAHRFYLGHNRAGLTIFGLGVLFVVLMVVFMSVGMDSVGKLSMLCFALVFVYGCVEAYAFTLHQAFGAIVSRMRG